MTLEDALEGYLNRQNVDPNVRRHIAAMRFYLRDLLWESATDVLKMNGGITNYTGLVRRSFYWAAQHDTRVCYVNFNYDHLLEDACDSNFGLQPSNLETYVRYPVASVLKPHGSVLWSWAHPLLSHAVNPLTPYVDSIWAGEPEGKPGTTIYCAGGPQDALPRSGGKSVPTLPALALPMTGKSQFVWPPEQDDLFRHGFANGCFGRVLIVGWRAAETHFTDLLQRLIPDGSRVMVVTGGGSIESASRDGAGTIKNLGEIRNCVESKVAPRGFSQLGNEEWDWLLRPKSSR